MCGLIAGSGRIQAKYLIALGCLSEVRGRDSAGVGWWRNGDAHVSKVAQNPLVAFPSTLYHCFKAAAKHKSPLIGHTRQATHGAVTPQNAHPFAQDNIAWAHNGVITNYRTFGEYEVDSQSLIHGIKERNFSKYYGNIALVWLEEGLLNAFRDGNPLFRGVRHRAMYLASQENMLKEIGCIKIKALSEGHHYIFKDMRITSVRKIPGTATRYIPRSNVSRVRGRVHGAYGCGYGEDWDWRDQDARFKALDASIQEQLEQSNLPIITAGANGKATIDESAQEYDAHAYRLPACYRCGVNPRAESSIWCKVCRDNVSLNQEYPYGD